MLKNVENCFNVILTKQIIYFHCITLILKFGINWTHLKIRYNHINKNKIIRITFLRII